MNSKINTFRDLRVWQEGQNLTLKIYQITKQFPREEMYGLTSQLRRAASSVPANIVEGYFRDTAKEFVKFIFNARGSAGEVVSFLLLSKDLKYLDDKLCKESVDRYDRLIRSLSALIKSLRKM